MGALEQLFIDIGRFNEVDFGVAYNDVDLCYRLVDKGLRCVYSAGSELSLLAGIAVADALERILGLSVQIKWPNDVMLRRQKIAGCLAEARDGAVVLGIGVNVGQSQDELPPNAGSIRTLTGRGWDREDLLATVLDDLGSRYAAWRTGGLDAVFDGLGPRDFLRGRQVTVNGTSGVATMIDREGRLEIAVGHGENVIVESGEVVYAR
jgi:BirA family biotin operon repressor/biotin-[acetyl-CoA-carboxylase] ligase